MSAIDSSAALTFLMSWLLTYLVHSTVLLGLAWIASRTIARHHPAILVLLWRGAMLGAIVTATLQSTGGVTPVSGTFHLPFENVLEAQPATTPVTPGVLTTSVQDYPASSLLAGAQNTTSPRPWWHLTIAGFWAAGAVLAFSRLASSAWRLRQLMRGRRPFHGGHFLARLARRMGLRKRVRLSLSEAVAMPFATGILKPEICLPRGLTTELDTAPSRALVAHEMAHLAHRDPAWRLLYRLIAGGLFLQPLNIVARRHLEHAAELLADDKAVSCTGKRLDLARCLVDVAERISTTAHSVPAAAALGAGSRLNERVARLLHDENRSRCLTRWAAPLLAASLVAVVVLLPGVSASSAEAIASSDAAITGTWSTTAEPPDPAEAPEAVAVPPAPSNRAPAPPSPPTAPAQPSPAAEAAPAKAPKAEAAPAPHSPPAAPAPPSPAAIELEVLREELRACERELQRLNQGLDTERQAAMEKVRAELARVRESARQVEREERAARERSRELAREQSRVAEEQRERAEQARERALAERGEARRRIEKEYREYHEQARAVARQEARSRRMAEEQSRQLAEQARELASAERVEARRIAHEARRLEAEARRKVQEEERRRAAEEHEREDDGGGIPK